MKDRRVQEILLPCRRNIPLSPAVSVNDKVTHAIQIMLENDVQRIVVVRKHKPIGIVRLEDALQAIGLQTGSGKV